MKHSMGFMVVLGLASLAAVQAAVYPSIADAAKANDLNMFLEASDKIGFTSQIKSPGFIGTVFAPTDEAFQYALDTAGITKKQLFANNSLLVDIVQYHVVPGAAISSDNLKNDGRYTSMRGKSLTITKSLGGDVAVNSGSSATVIDKDQKAGAAMFNVIDNLLLPPDELASLNLKQADQVKFYTNLEEAAGWDGDLTTFSQAIFDSGLSPYLSNPTTVATLFAPTDDAWYTIDRMSTYYTGNVSAITGSKKQLANLLKYHIIPDKAYRAGQLKDKMVLKTDNGETIMVHVTSKPARKAGEVAAAAGAVLAAKISGVDPSMHILLTPNSDGDEATVTSADIIAGRSYMHKVDAVLVPKSTLAFLDSFTADSGKKKKNATVAEALSGNATANGTAANATAAAADGDAAASNSNSKNATATSGAAGLAAAALLGAPLLLAVLLL